MGCQTFSKNANQDNYKGLSIGEVGSAHGQWTGKALIRNRQTQESGRLQLDIVAIEPGQMRIEALGAFGVHVASVALNGGQIQYALTREKKFVSAPAAQLSFARLIRVDLSVADFMKLLFDRRFDRSNWNCRRGTKGEPMVEECVTQSGNLSLIWTEKEGPRRRLELRSQQMEVQLILEDVPTKVEVHPEMFKLVPPPGYRRQIMSKH